MEGAHTRRNFRQWVRERWRNLRRWLEEHKWIKNLPESLVALALWFIFSLLIYALIYKLVSFLATLKFFLADALDLLRKLLSESTSLLAAFVTALLGFAVQQWRSRTEREREREERKREVFGELEQMNQFLERREFASALRLYRSIRRRCEGIWKGLDVEERIDQIWGKAPRPLQIWAELSENRRKPALEWEVLEALVWGWQVDPERREVAEKILRETFPSDRPEALVALLQKQLGWRTVLRSGLLGRWLSKLPKKSSKANTLRTWRDTPPHLPSPWEGVLRPSEDRGFADWLKAWGLSFNPFGPEHAELDPELAEYGVWPAALEEVRKHRPAIVFAPPGFGRTAAARLLAHECSKATTPETRLFPVFVEADNWPQTPRGWLEAISSAVAKNLLQACVQDPYALFEHPGGPAVAQLLASCFGAGESLAHLLHRLGMDGEAQAYVLGEVGRFAPGEVEPDRATLKALLQHARPAGFTDTYAILDIPLPPPSENSAGPSLSFLVGWVIPLMSHRVLLKIFLPEALRPFLEGPWPVEPLSLRWSEEELREMIGRRLQTAGKGTEASLATMIPDDPETYLVRSAGGSPRQLVRLGNQLLETAYRSQKENTGWRAQRYPLTG